MGLLGNSSTSATSGGTDGWFSEILSGISAGVSKVASEVLPVWAANELNVQSTDQIYRNMYDWDYSPPRVDSKTGVQSPSKFISNMTTTDLLMWGALIVGGVIVLKKVL